MTYGFLPQCLYGTNTSPVGDIIYKKSYEDRRMQKKKNLYKKSKYYRQRQKKIRQICMAAGGVLLLVVLILIVRGCAGKTKSVNSSNVNNATDEKTTGSALSSDSEKNDSSFADGTKQTAESSSDSSDSSSDSESSDTISTKSKHDTPVTLTISVVGDCTLGTDEAFDYSTSLNAYFENYGKEYFLQNVKSIFEADDLTIANNEGTFTDSSSREDKTFAFKAPASFAGIYSSSSVEAVNTANNHSHDYGEQSFQDTMDALDAQGIVHFGYDETAVMDIKGVKVGLVGIYELYDHLEREQQLKDNIAKVKEDGAELIIVIFHWGNEKETVPDSNQTTLGHLAIDLGADLVCGHHPHVLQGVEYYKGKPIVYSLGNFIFGSSIPKTALLKVQWDGENSKLTFVPGTSSVGYTRVLENTSQKSDFASYMTSISYGVSIEEDGSVVLQE